MKLTYIKLSKNNGKRYLDKKDKGEKQKILNVNSEERFLNKSYKNVEDNCKNEERKERAKKILSKNQVALYTISLMLIASGYFNYTNNLKMAELGDAQLVSTNLSVNENEVIDETNEITANPSYENEANETSTKPSVENEASETSTNSIYRNETTTNSSYENEVKEVNIENEVNEQQINEVIPSSNNTESREYFAQTKLERDKMYSQMIETYQKILENNNISTEQKNTASEEIKNINNKRNGIATSETLIKAKGIEEIVIIVNSDVIDAIVKSKDNLSTEQVAQISNIISRELNANIENIHITTHE